MGQYLESSSFHSPEQRDPEAVSGTAGAGTFMQVALSGRTRPQYCEVRQMHRPLSERDDELARVRI